jgi:hypothetical protein
VSEFLADWASTRRTPFEWFQVVGEADARSSELRDLLRQYGLPFRAHAADSESGRRLLAEAGHDESRLPVVVGYDGRTLVDPSRADSIGRAPAARPGPAR